MISRRLRGILRTTLAACVAWTALGLVVGATLQLQYASTGAFAFGRPIPGGFAVAFAIAGAFVGIINGLTFSLLVIATERGKRVEQLRGWRMATWAALATGGPAGFLLQSPLIAGVGAAMGAAGVFAALRAARRAPKRGQHVLEHGPDGVATHGG